MNAAGYRFGLMLLVLACCVTGGAHRTVFAADTKTYERTGAIGKESSWPLAITSASTKLTVYQPQLDAWDGFHLTARMAVRASTGSKAAQVTYGIVTMQAQTLTDKGTRVVTINNAVIVKSDFSSATAAQTQAWTKAIEQDFAGKSHTIALDRLQQQLAINAAQKNDGNVPLRNIPPEFIFSSVPAILIYVDGKPVYRTLPGLPFERIINTRPLVLRDSTSTYYLKIFDGWMTAPALTGPWRLLHATSAYLDEAYKQTSNAYLIDALSGQSAPDKPGPSLKSIVPNVLVATRPTELIVTDGAPRYTAISGTNLSYVSNTTGHVLRHAPDNKTYVLVSGRWFRASGELGPWEFVAANDLPADFARIPDDSPVENIKASVAGTAQAADAVIAATVPQTAAVNIVGTQLAQPQFDGAPLFKTIEGTTLEYVANSATPIVRVAGSGVYAVQDGVWFRASSVSGPWSVATMVPLVIYSIPPSSPLYYLTYVKIYAVSGNTVYVGYTPGYQGAYIDPLTGVVVYGTGYAYEPWVSSYWYGDPVTYGYAASIAYTPWTGWAYGFGFGWFWGAATVAYGWGWGPYPYWGPWAYPAWGRAWGAAGGSVAWGPGGWAGYSGNIYQQWGNRASVSREYGGFDAWTGNEWAGRVGASYNSRTGIASAGQRGAIGNVYSGNYAAGARGVATGPQGNVVVGARGTAGNAYSGNEVHGNRGAYYDKSTGQWTTFGGASGQDGGHVAHVGDDVYAGKDGKVYRNTGDGWQQHTSNGWQSVPGSNQGQATRDASGGLGASHNMQPSATNMQQAHPEELERERNARMAGGQQTHQLRQSSMGMHRGGFRRR
ncbi:RHS repeat domain-containing protein [Herminiimonas contaminans]|uniref:Autotransporter n=1 Tax=Herminiimonas contaminans TaxID=1111140 RepID=A0ABS0ESK4_9BURK|nr:autotransporter [Herminiimonas contaminans]MBF8177739.1 autotransporter [Herminiimonas contaminans]